MQVSAPPRRFRRRGGAKKKKKSNSPDDTPTQPPTDGHGNWTATRPNRAPCMSLDAVAISPGRVSATTPPVIQTSSSFAPLFSAVPPDQLSYLQKVSASLDQLQPGDPAAAADAALLSRNALVTLAPNLPDLAREPTPARLLQSLIAAAGPPAAPAVVDALLAAGLPAISVHICASRVLQDALLLLPQATAGRTGVEDVTDPDNRGSNAAAAAADDEAEASASASANRPGRVPSSLCYAVAELSTNDFFRLAHDRNASHVLRAAFAALAGIPPDEPPPARLDDAIPSGTPYFRAMHLSAPSLPAGDALSALADKLLTGEDGHDGSGSGGPVAEEENSNLASLAHDAKASAALQGLLSALSFAGHDTLVSRLAEAAAPAGTVEALLTSRTGSRLLDRILLVTLESPAHAYLREPDALTRAAAHPAGNFPAQRFIAALQHRAALATALTALEPKVPALLSPGSPREGVVLALARTAERFGDANQRLALARAVARAVGATAGAGRELPLALAMRGLPAARAWRTALQGATPADWLHEGGGRREATVRVPGGLPRAAPLGVLLARSLLRMPGSAGQPARDALASLSHAEIVVLLLDGAGSRLLDGWMESSGGGGSSNNGSSEREAKTAGKILAALGVVTASAAPAAVAGDQNDRDALLVGVCAKPCAALVVAHCVARLGNVQRRKAMQRFSTLYDRLSSTAGGESLLRKCRVQQFMQRQGDWEQEESARETKQRLFADILANEEDDADGGAGAKPANAEASQEGKRKRERGKDNVRKKRKRSETSTDKNADETMPSAIKDDKDDDGLPHQSDTAAAIEAELPSGVVFDTEPMLMEEPKELSLDVKGEELGLGTVLAAIKAAGQGSGKGKKQGKDKSKKKRRKGAQTKEGDEVNETVGTASGQSEITSPKGTSSSAQAGGLGGTTELAADQVVGKESDKESRKVEKKRKRRDKPDKGGNSGEDLGPDATGPADSLEASGIGREEGKKRTKKRKK